MGELNRKRGKPLNFRQAGTLVLTGQPDLLALQVPPTEPVGMLTW